MAIESSNKKTNTLDGFDLKKIYHKNMTYDVNHDGINVVTSPDKMPLIKKVLSKLNNSEGLKKDFSSLKNTVNKKRECANISNKNKPK